MRLVTGEVWKVMGGAAVSPPDFPPTQPPATERGQVPSTEKYPGSRGAALVDTDRLELATNLCEVLQLGPLLGPFAVATTSTSPFTFKNL